MITSQLLCRQIEWEMNRLTPSPAAKHMSPSEGGVVPRARQVFAYLLSTGSRSASLVVDNALGHLASKRRCTLLVLMTDIALEGIFLGLQARTFARRSRIMARAVQPAQSRVTKLTERAAHSTGG